MAALTALSSIRSDAQNSGQSFVDYVNNEAQSQQYKEQVKQALWYQKFGDNIPMDENAFNKTSDGTIFIKSDYTPQGFMGTGGVQSVSQNGDLSKIPVMGAEGGQTSSQLGTDTAPIAPFRALTQDDLITMHKEGIPLAEMKDIDDTLWSSENLKKNIQETAGDARTIGFWDYLSKGVPAVPDSELSGNSGFAKMIVTGAANIVPNIYQIGASLVSWGGSVVSSFIDPKEAARQGGAIVHGVENVAQWLYDNFTDPNAAARQGGEILGAVWNYIKSAQTQPLNTLILNPSTIDEIISGAIGKRKQWVDNGAGSGWPPDGWPDGWSNPPDGWNNLVDSALGIDKNFKTALMNDPHGSEYLPKFFDDAEKNGQTTEEVQNEELWNLADNLKGAIKEAQDGKSGIGKIYNEAYQAGGAVPVQGENGILNAIDAQLDKAGFSVDDEGNIIDNKKFNTLDISPAQIAKLKEIRDRVISNADGGVLSAEEAHVLRQKLDTMIEYSPWEFSPIKNTMNTLLMGIRRDVGTAMKENLPWFADLDKAFMDKLDENNDFLKGIVYDGGKREWQVRDNIQQIVKTINNPNRAEMKERLTQIMPDLATRSQSIQNMTKLAKMAQKHNDRMTTTVWGAIGSWVGTALGGIPWAIAWATIGAWIGFKVSRLWAALRLARLKNIVNTGSEIQRAKKIDLLNKMSARAEMSARDKAKAQDIVNKIRDTKVTAEEIRATAKAMKEENARAEEAKQAQARASAQRAQKQAQKEQAKAKQAEAQKYADIRAKNQNLGQVAKPTPVNSEIPKIAEEKPAEVQEPAPSPKPTISKPQEQAKPAQNAPTSSETEAQATMIPEKAENVEGFPYKYKEMWFSPVKDGWKNETWWYKQTLIKQWQEMWYRLYNPTTKEVVEFRPKNNNETITRAWMEAEAHAINNRTVKPPEPEWEDYHNPAQEKIDNENWGDGGKMIWQSNNGKDTIPKEPTTPEVDKPKGSSKIPAPWDPSTYRPLTEEEKQANENHRLEKAHPYIPDYYRAWYDTNKEVFMEYMQKHQTAYKRELSHIRNLNIWKDNEIIDQDKYQKEVQELHGKWITKYKQHTGK